MGRGGNAKRRSELLYKRRARREIARNPHLHPRNFRGIYEEVDRGLFLTIREKPKQGIPGRNYIIPLTPRHSELPPSAFTRPPSPKADERKWRDWVYGEALCGHIKSPEVSGFYVSGRCSLSESLGLSPNCESDLPMNRQNCPIYKAWFDFVRGDRKLLDATISKEQEIEQQLAKMYGPEEFRYFIGSLSAEEIEQQ